MGLKFRKTVKTGPFRHTITHKGIGSSIGILGAGFGITPSGDFYISFGISKTGLYYIKYFKREKSSNNRGPHLQKNGPIKKTNMRTENKK